jgi:hypothetical protein
MSQSNSATNIIKRANLHTTRGEVDNFNEIFDYSSTIDNLNDESGKVQPRLSVKTLNQVKQNLNKRGYFKSELGKNENMKLLGGCKKEDCDSIKKFTLNGFVQLSKTKNLEETLLNPSLPHNLSDAYIGARVIVNWLHSLDANMVRGPYAGIDPGGDGISCDDAPDGSPTGACHSSYWPRSIATYPNKLTDLVRADFNKLYDKNSTESQKIRNLTIEALKPLKGRPENEINFIADQMMHAIKWNDVMVNEGFDKPDKRYGVGRYGDHKNTANYNSGLYCFFGNGARIAENIPQAQRNDQGKLFDSEVSKKIGTPPSFFVNADQRYREYSEQQWETAKSVCRDFMHKRQEAVNALIKSAAEEVIGVPAKK